jgi:hypothetical protein
MKWVETTRELLVVSVGSWVVAAAMRVMEMDDVLVARMACLGQIWASLENMSNLSEGISGTASMTKSTSASESIEVVGVRRARAASACSWVMRFLATSLARSFSGEGGMCQGLVYSRVRRGQPTGKANALVQGVLRRVDKGNGHLGLDGGHEGYPQALYSGKDNSQRRTA